MRRPVKEPGPFEEVWERGLEEYFDGQAVVLLEWPEVMRPLLPAERLEITQRFQLVNRYIIAKFLLPYNSILFCLLIFYIIPQ